MKHTRPIILEPWQQEIANTHPGHLIRGLIHSDGCRVINRVKHYQYVRYFFSNNSGDIRRISTDACDQLGIEHRHNKRFQVSIARRDSVAIMERIVGPKR